METSPLRVVIADDDHRVLKVVEAEAQRSGFEVVGRATDGVQAVALAVSLRPDVVLMDYQMPEMDGIEAAIKIQEQCPTPVILITGYESPGLLARAAEAGIGAYLVKPPQAHEIERAVLIARARFQDLVALRHLNQELRLALEKISTLEGMLPICAWCKKVRDDEGYWEQIETYLADHTKATFTHGICPECRAKQGVPHRAPT